MKIHLFSVFLLLVLPTRGDWIDPDTPLAAYYTQQLDAIPESIPPKPQKTQKKKKNTTTTKEPSTTAAPSVSPSADSPAPSTNPSSQPSTFPTLAKHDYTLVFSDEFQTPGRSLADGHDPRWTALEKNDYTNDALHYYTAENVYTEKGQLIIASEAGDTDVIGFDDVHLKKVHKQKHFRSGMVQSWNKFCFTGGIVEAEVILPGKAPVGGLWPAFWLLGNLARHTYVGTSQHVWPWSNNAKCSANSAAAQRISPCHEAAHFGMNSHHGRGAPEMDIFEVQPGNIRANQGPFLQMPVGQPFASASYQVAPGRALSRPGDGVWPGPGQWYEGLLGGRNTSVNILFYGNYNHFRGDLRKIQDYWSDAISMNRQLDEDYFAKPHIFRLEWEPPNNETYGYLHWFLDGKLVFRLPGSALHKAGYGAEISSEPSYILLNTAISTQWGFPQQCPANCPCKNYDCHSRKWEDICGFSEGFCDMMKSADRPEYRINWVRVYQDANNPLHKVGCSTPERPTRRWIEAHEDQYKTEQDVRPLRGIQRGGGVCHPHETSTAPTACGGMKRGRCTAGRVCECQPGWTGPHCLAHQGSDPILYDQPDRITDVGFVPPRVAPLFLLLGGGILVLLLVSALMSRHRLEGWTPIPDVMEKEMMLQSSATR